MSQEWNIRSRAHVCAFCGKPLVDRAPVTSVLKEAADGYERFDCHPECWKTQPRDWEAFSEWQGVYAAPPPPDARREPIKKETADELLRELVALDDPAMKNVVYVLAVMLERAKILVERDVREQDDHAILRVYEHKATGESFVVLDPRLRLENLADVQRQVVALLSGTKTLGEVSAQEEGAAKKENDGEGKPMKILIVGSGGREHAITWRLAQDEAKHALFCAPGNAGTAALAENVAIGAEDVAGIVTWARENKPDLVVVGPEAPLCAGLVDALSAVGVKAFGPPQAGARIEGSKRFAKEIMEAAGVPTGKARTFTDAAAAKQALADFGLPVVIKADGLAAGKGVVVAETREQAEAAIDDMLVANKFGAAGAEVLVEEFLDGEECSILALVDGERAVLLPSSQDHKRAFDGDKGPNTGGMGAYSPAPVATDDLLPAIKEKIVLPVVRELAKRGIVYKGVLYAGLMITPPGGKTAASGSRVNVVEFNARFGDPETEAVLPRLGGDFARVLLACAEGKLSDDLVVVKPKSAATVIVASGGYPGAYEKGKPVAGLEAAAETGAVVFHCGTKAVDGAVVTAGGRVFSVTGLGADLRAAVDAAYAGVAKISFAGAFHRSDVAHRAFERQAAEAAR